MGDAKTPINTATNGVTKPADGVIETSPATIPVMLPSNVGFPNFTHSIIIQDNIAPTTAKLVVKNALTATELTLKALPVLNPSQPIQRKTAPINERGKLCGTIPFGYVLCPSINHPTSPAINAAICTTRQPAKSKEHIYINQPRPHT